MSENTEQKKTSVSGSATRFGVGTLISRVFGFIRDILITSYLSRDITDAWNVAVKLPQLLRRLAGEGAISSGFIPVFLDYRKNKSSESKDVLNEFFSFIFLLSLFLSILAFIFMPQIIESWVGEKGFIEHPGKLELTVWMARLCIPFFILMMLFAFFMTTLNALGRFALSGFAPALLNISLIVSCCLFAYFPGKEPLVLCLGFLLGGALQVVILIPSVMKLKLFPRITLNLFSSRLSKVLKLFGPAFLSIAVMQIIAIINVKYASFLDQGAITYIYLADRVLDLPSSLISVSLQTALLPTLTAAWVSGRKDILEKELGSALRSNYFLIIPAAVGMFFLSDNIAIALFNWKNFKIEEAHTVGMILRFYSLVLICFGGVRIFSQGFFATQNTLHPSKVSIFILIFHGIIAYFLTINFGLPGLVVSTGISSLLNLIILGISYRYIIGRFDLLNLIKACCKFIVCAGVMAAVLLGLQYVEVYFSGGKSGQILFLLVSVVTGAFTYFIFCLLLKVKEVELLKKKILRRF